MTRPSKELPGQLTLDGLDAPTSSVQAARPTHYQPKSIGWSRCPYGRHSRLTGVFYGQDCRLVFRDHTIRLGSAVLLCRGSGQSVPDRHTVHEG